MWVLLVLYAYWSFNNIKVCMYNTVRIAIFNVSGIGVCNVEHEQRRSIAATLCCDAWACPARQGASCKDRQQRNRSSLRPPPQRLLSHPPKYMHNSLVRFVPCFETLILTSHGECKRQRPGRGLIATGPTLQPKHPTGPSPVELKYLWPGPGLKKSITRSDLHRLKAKVQL